MNKTWGIGFRVLGSGKPKKGGRVELDLNVDMFDGAFVTAVHALRCPKEGVIRIRPGVLTCCFRVVDGCAGLESHNPVKATEVLQGTIQKSGFGSSA